MTHDLQLRTAVSDYLETLDARIADVVAQIEMARDADDVDRVDALRDELKDLDELYHSTEEGTSWDAERAFRGEYGGAS